MLLTSAEGINFGVEEVFAVGKVGFREKLGHSFAGGALSDRHEILCGQICSHGVPKLLIAGKTILSAS